MEWNGMGWSRMEWNGMGCNGMGQKGMEWNGDLNLRQEYCRCSLHVSPDTHTQTETKVTENKF